MTMHTRIIRLLPAVALVAALPAQAALNLFACEPEWAALAVEIGGANVNAYAATTGLQDIHQIQARPSLIAKMRSADLLVCAGAELEVGWLPMVQRQASNPRIQPGAAGYFEASSAVTMLEVPGGAVDRSQGDIHPFGNPHLQTDPRNLIPVAHALAKRMAALDGAHAAEYVLGAQRFEQRWREHLAVWEKRAAPLKGQRFVAHHNSWPYLEAWTGIDIVGFLEPKPGIPPSSTHLAHLLDELKAQPVRGIIRSGYEDARPSEWLAQRTGAMAVLVPQTIGATPAARDLAALYDAMLDSLLGALPNGGK
jgi:zinc/manganese transport system substrate-binding protein